MNYSHFFENIFHFIFFVVIYLNLIVRIKIHFDWLKNSVELKYLWNIWIVKFYDTMIKQNKYENFKSNEFVRLRDVQKKKKWKKRSFFFSKMILISFICSIKIIKTWWIFNILFFIRNFYLLIFFDRRCRKLIHFYLLFMLRYFNQTLLCSFRFLFLFISFTCYLCDYKIFILRCQL